MADVSTSNLIVSELRGAVKYVRFNRPEVRNAIVLESGDAVCEAIASSVDEGARVVVLTGSGGSFCAGADLKSITSTLGSGEVTSLGDLLRQHYHPVIKTMTELPIPVIAAVDGPAAGIGCDFALAADMRLMSERAFLAEIFVNIGLIPDGGGTFHLPRLIGLGRAIEMAMTGRRIPADECHAWGLANEVYPTDEFEHLVARFAEELAAKAPLSLMRSKQAYRAALVNSSLGEALDREATFQEELFGTEDFREGVSAFIEKRPAKFTGK